MRLHVSNTFVTFRNLCLEESWNVYSQETNLQIGLSGVGISPKCFRGHLKAIIDSWRENPEIVGLAFSCFFLPLNQSRSVVGINYLHKTLLNERLFHICLKIMIYKNNTLMESYVTGRQHSENHKIRIEIRNRCSTLTFYLPCSENKVGKQVLQLR